MLSFEEWEIMCLGDLSGPYQMHESCYYRGAGGDRGCAHRAAVEETPGRSAGVAKVFWP